MYQSMIYTDQLMRVRIDAEDAPDNIQAMRAMKEVLKARFKQLDIWITSHRIDIIWSPAEIRT